MGDNTRDVSDSRGQGRRDTAYSEAELSAFGAQAAALDICDQVGLAVARIDGPDIHLSRLAEHWVGSERDAFASSSVMKSAARTTDPDAQWDYASETGRVLRIRRAQHESKVLLFFHDVTLEADHRHVLDASVDIGVGFLHHSLESGRLMIFGDLVDRLLTPKEQLELRRSRFRSLLHPRDQKRYDVLFQGLVENGTPIDAVLECTCRKLKSFRIQLRLSAVRSQSGRIVKAIGGFRDVTVERKAKAELVRIRNEHEANREARRFMIARIAHEVKTPLNGVMGMAQVIEKRTDLSPELKEQVAIMVGAARDAIQHIDSLMKSTAVGERPASAVESVDVTSTIRECVGLWKSSVQDKGVAVETAIHPDAPRYLQLNGLRLRQCLTNILSNAAKFTSMGSIRIAYGLVGSGGSEKVVIAVRDTGIGMNAAELNMLFTPFQQANATISDQFGGSGLGMSITKSLVRDMGGSVRAESEPGKGTTIALTFPYQAVKPVEATSADLVDNLLESQDLPARSYPKLRVLAVDDNQTNRLVVEQLLKDSVGEITSAANGREALECLGRQEFDVVLMDIHMPVMDGIEATLAIRRSNTPYADVPIVALTADTQYQQKRVVMNLGMDEAVAKPVTLSKLLGVFEALRLSDEEALVA